MSQRTVQLSDRADALIDKLQKDIFQRRRKKVTPAAVLESLVESGARSQSDKRFATSWRNLVVDIEKSARIADAHGTKPASLSDEEWAMVLSHRSRAGVRKAGSLRVATASAGSAPDPARPAARRAKRSGGGSSPAGRPTKAADRLRAAAAPALAETGTPKPVAASAGERN